MKYEIELLKTSQNKDDISIFAIYEHGEPRILINNQQLAYLIEQVFDQDFNAAKRMIEDSLPEDYLHLEEH